jgi:hypothetical protein
MEFIEAPAFTRYVSEYLADDEYRQLQNQLVISPELGDMMPGTGGSENSVGLTRSAARDAEAVCGPFTTTS